MPCQQHFEIINLWLATTGLPKYLFGACQLDFGFLWWCCQRAANSHLVTMVAQPLGLWLASHRADNSALASPEPQFPVTFQTFNLHLYGESTLST